MTHAKPVIRPEQMISREPCDGFRGQTWCWLVHGAPLWGKHYRTKGAAKDAIARVVNRALERDLADFRAKVAKKS